MKKRVRVYKPGGEAQQPTQQQIIDYIKQVMKSGDYNPETLSNQLTQFGISNDDAAKYIQYVSDDLYANGEDTENPETDYDQADDTQSDNTEASYAKHGGSKLTKGNFIKQYTKFAKMAQGGDTPSPGSDDVLDGRKNLVDGFLNAVTGSANDAALRQEAEAQYHYAYGGAKVGAFQEGGIHQEEIDPENFYHHLNLYGQEAQGVFADNQNIKSRQFGGFTDPNSGLYKFIGGGDNESADEEYQDSDIDFNQEEYQMGGFRMPRRSGRQYTQAVNSPYYTATGERAAAPDLVNRQVSSVDVTKRGIFGRPKAYTVNYGNPSSTVKPTFTMPTEDQAKVIDAKNAVNDKANTIGVKTPPAPGEYTGPDEFTGRRQPLANFMMRTGIPGIRGLGAKMIKSGPAPEVPNVIPETFGTNDLQKRDSYGNPVVNKTAETFGTEKYDFKNNAITSPDRSPMQDFQYKPTELVGRPRTEMQMPQSRQEKYITDNADDGRQKLQDFLIRQQGQAYKEYGGPIDYTEYAYGGDIAIPELYKAVDGVQVAFDPNKNNTSFSNLQSSFTGTPTKDVAGTPIQPTVPESMQPKNITIDPNQPNRESVLDQPDNVSQDFVSKKDWNKIGDDFALGKAAVEGTLDKVDQINAQKQENQMLANTTSAEANYGISNADNRGNYDPNSGLFRPDQMGSNAVVKYGGGIYAMGGNTEDDDEDIEYMTEDQIKRFLAEGGELEYV
jgi:hypothetical protein